MKNRYLGGDELHFGSLFYHFSSWLLEICVLEEVFLQKKRKQFNSSWLMLNSKGNMLIFGRFMLTFIGFMLMFSTFMLISLPPMLKYSALCLSSCLYAFLLRNMLIRPA
ncbi:hypothetical protein CUU66_15295 [Peribacillus deserti]|uniref:Uncharacterized protein n=1 Tax=Peribacillus deserti TaxID=673318 RepID=A0A2N5M3S7_9BACI|nr:hypothetical protein CUU66_15295 [Peribacillus deserti]